MADPDDDCDGPWSLCDRATNDLGPDYRHNPDGDWPHANHLDPSNRDVDHHHASHVGCTLVDTGRDQGIGPVTAGPVVIWRHPIAWTFCLSVSNAATTVALNP